MSNLFPELSLLRLQGLSIFQQLQIEEALLRTDRRNWCLLHSGAPPAIVMGISGKRALLIDDDECRRQGLPIIRRFSGGGTVVIDEHTCLATLIFNSDNLAVVPFPEPIMRWSADLYRPLFPNLDFQLRESDYTLAEHKCGGNAQYLCRGRWLHHTSFLWDYSEERMSSLTLPQRTPAYRLQRPHSSFVCRLREKTPQYTSPQAFLDAIACHLSSLFKLIPSQLSDIEEILTRPHRRAVAFEK